MQTEAVVGRLAALGCVAPDAEAAVLLDDEPSDALVLARLERRATGEPLAWIVGWTEVADARVRVDPDVYVPRPQTAELIGRAVGHLPAAGRLVDLCCGSGAIPAVVADTRPDASTFGVDLDARSVRCARRNGVVTVQADAGAAPFAPGRADVVTAVAPYVPTGQLALLPADVVRHEPLSALDGGDDGLAVVRQVVTSAARLLRSGGWLLVELGGEQADGLAPILTDRGFDAATTWTDDEGDVRGVEAQLAARSGGT